MPLTHSSNLRLICAPFLVTSLTIGTVPNTHSSFSFSSFIWTSICTAKPKLGLGTMLDTHSSSLRLICAYFHAAWFTLVTIHSSLLVRFSWAAIIEISMVSQLLFSFLFGWCGWYHTCGGGGMTREEGQSENVRKRSSPPEPSADRANCVCVVSSIRIQNISR